MSEILEVDMLAFERGDRNQRKAVVDGVRRSLETGFVLTRHDLSEELLDAAYAMLQQFFTSPFEEKQRWTLAGAHGQTGYTGVLVETAASSETPDWKEMLNWSTPIAPGHPLKRKFAQAYPDQVLPEETVPGITKVLYAFHDTIAELQRRFLRIIAEGIGCHETFFDEMVADGPTLTRAIRYPPMAESPEGDGSGHYVWAAEHGDINLITALPRATAPGLQVRIGQHDDAQWVDAVAPDGQVIINTGIMLERLTNGQIPIGWHRVVAAPGYAGERYSVVQFCHPRPWTILSPVPSCCTPDTPQRFHALSAADALDEVLYQINLVEDAPARVTTEDQDSGLYLDEPTEQLEPPRQLAPAILAIDIGGAQFSAGLVTTKGELVDRAAAALEQDVGPEAHFSNLATIVELQLELADRHDLRVAAVGVGCAGPITGNCETVSPAAVSSWREFPLRERLRELTSKRVYGDLDGKALALAEGWMGAAKGHENYCVMSVSTGIGGGIVLDGELLDGASTNAGHVGHLIVDPNGRRCGCGARGCLEAEASGLAIEAITGRSPTEPTYEIMQRTGMLVGRAAASICNLLDLDLVVVGGAVALGFAATFFNAAQEELSTSARLPYSRQARITPTRLGDRAPLVGAGAVGIRGWSRDRSRIARKGVAAK